MLSKDSHPLDTGEKLNRFESNTGNLLDKNKG